MVLINYDVIIAIASRGKFLVQKTDFWETAFFPGLHITRRDYQRLLLLTLQPHAIKDILCNKVFLYTGVIIPESNSEQKFFVKNL